MKKFLTEFDVNSVLPFFAQYDYYPFSFLFVGLLFFISSYLLLFRFRRLNKKYIPLVIMSFLMTIGYMPCQLIYLYSMKVGGFHLLFTLITESIAACAILYCLLAYYEEKQ